MPRLFDVALISFCLQSYFLKLSPSIFVPLFAMASAAVDKVSRCYALGNHVTAEDTMLKSKVFAAIFEAMQEGVLSPSEGEECMTCLFEFQANILAAAEPLLRALDVLTFSADRVRESGGSESMDRPTMLIRDVQARFRDAVAHGLFAHNLGFDSKKQFISLVWQLQGCCRDTDLSSKMQNAYMKIMKTYQEWFRVLDLKSGHLEGEVDASRSTPVSPKKSPGRKEKKEASASSSSPNKEEFPGAQLSNMEPMKVTVSAWLEEAL